MKRKLTLLFACTLLAASAFAQISGACGPNLTWTTYDNYTLTISGTGEMDDCHNGAPWDSFRYHIQAVVFEDGVTSIGDYAFYNCDALTSITLPNSLTSIGYMAFFNCISLTSVTIPNSVTSIGDMAFSQCSGLTSVNLGNSVTSIGDGAFASCHNLTSVTIGNSVTSIGDDVFINCYSLTSINIPNSVTSIGDMAFSNCGDLTTIEVASDNPNYSSQDGVLFDKEQTSIICYPSGKLDTTYTIPNSVTSIGHSAFYYCDGLTEITIPNSVTSIGDMAFSLCTGLKQVTVKWKTPLALSVYSSIFFGYVNISNVKLLVPAGTADLYRAAPVWQDFKIESIELGSDVSATSANVSWYAVENAASYTLTVYSDADMTQVVGAYEFDASGQQLRATQADEKFVAQITGLSPETSYYYKLEAFDSTETVIDTFQDEFTTLSAITGIENTTNNDEVISTQYYNLQGRIVASPQQGQVYIAKELHQSGKTTVRKVVK